jgi:hypothetical protein
MQVPLSLSRIIVSAPKGTAPGGSVPNTGLVYSCPVNPGTCSPLPGKLFDTTRESLMRFLEILSPLDQIALKGMYM